MSNAGGPGEDDLRWLRAVVARATQNVADGGGPFGAAVVRDGELLAFGENRVTRDLDPTAHAEVLAIRRACQGVESFSLVGATLYASCEPCPLCMASALWARVDRVVYAADRDDAARGGFDDREFYALFERPRETWPVEVVAATHASGTTPFEAWLADPRRTEY